MALSEFELEQRLQIQQKIIAFSPSSFGCADCPFTSSYKNSMVNHIEARHSDGVVYPCPVCDKVCNSRVALSMHNRRVHLKPPRQPEEELSAVLALMRCEGPASFSCAACHFVSASKRFLFEHIRSNHL